MSLVGFDLEIATPLDPTRPLEDQLPCGIACAVFLALQPSGIALYGYRHGEWILSEGNSRFAPSMDRAAADRLVLDLEEFALRGYYIITLNGAGFDLRVLAEEASPELWHRVARLCLEHHIDIGFQMVCEMGYMVGLRAACEGMGVEGKSEDMDGVAAPALWQGTIDDQCRVMAYCAQDVRATLALYQAIVKRGMMEWTSRSGKRNVWMPRIKVDGSGHRLLTVAECLAEIPLPDTSWMTNPRPRQDYVGWLLG